MPTYDFAHVDTGEVREFNVPAGTGHLRRTDGIWKLQPVLTMQVAGLRPQVDARDTALAGYYRQECAQGARFKSKYTKAQIKRAWAT